jgi:hypothetical protein
MNQALVNQITSAVLYEGYILYPYRPSVKNRQRWTFGGLVPRAFSEAQAGSEPWEMQTECLLAGGPGTTITCSVRFLRLVARLVGQFSVPQQEWPAEGAVPCPIVELLRVGDQVLYTWQEAVEQTIDLGKHSLAGLAAQSHGREFMLEPQRDRQPLRDDAGMFVGAVVREHRRVRGVVEIGAIEVAHGAFRVTVKIQNETPFQDAAAVSRDEALMHGLVSTHTVLSVADGEFVSMIDPPESYRDLAARCRNVGCWPVLIGAEGDKDTILSAPIILYDYPQIAPESPGELFDGTEIDEILTLRIMTLTDDEKVAMAAVDERARAILARTETLGKDQMLRLHGTFRGLQPFLGERNHG